MTSFEVKSREQVRAKRIEAAVKAVEEKLSNPEEVFPTRFREVHQDSCDRDRVALRVHGKLTRMTEVNYSNYTPRAFNNLQAICRILDVDANYLLGLTDERKSLKEIQANSTFSEF